MMYVFKAKLLQGAVAGGLLLHVCYMFHMQQSSFHLSNQGHRQSDTQATSGCFAASLSNFESLRCAIWCRFDGVTAYQTDWSIAAVTLRAQGSPLQPEGDQPFNLPMASLEGQPGTGPLCVAFWLQQTSVVIIICLTASALCLKIIPMASTLKIYAALLSLALLAYILCQ